jgi:hypothetical protein
MEKIGFENGIMLAVFKLIKNKSYPRRKND